jgi:hypothetical protein
LIEAARRAARALLRPSEKPPNPDVVKPESKPPEAEDLQLQDVNANKCQGGGSQGQDARRCEEL